MLDAQWVIKSNQDWFTGKLKLMGYKIPELPQGRNSKTDVKPKPTNAGRKNVLFVKAQSEASTDL